MARINKQDVLKEMQVGLQLDVVREKTPDQLADKILPVYQVNPSSRIILVEDLVINDFSKEFTIPNNKKWKMLYGHVTLATDANVADRRVVIRFRDTGNFTLYEAEALNTQAASLTERYTFGQFGDVSESVGNRHTLPIPSNSILIEDFNILINVVNGQATDDLTVKMIIEESDMNPNR